MPPTVAAFGHGVPLTSAELAGLSVTDVTRIRHPAPPDSRIAPLLEPFLDPFARSFLFGLEGGSCDGVDLILVWRPGPGAIHAYRYASELRRLGLLPPGPPLHLWNAAQGETAAARHFDRTESARLDAALAGLPRVAPVDHAGSLATLEALQAAGRISGADAQRRRLTARAEGRPVDPTPASPPPPDGPRLALAGAPLGNDALHRRIETQGRLVLDMQGPDAPLGKIGDLLFTRGIERLFWQVDPHDDLHGWRMPGLRDLCARLGIVFVDLGFVPAWPEAGDLARLDGLRP